jgi:NAD(P)-dependent dehydrogenase (short-subunit alcohol dehydrogenase family)
MKNSVAIVTGACQGIGRSTAIRLARDFSAGYWLREMRRRWRRSLLRSNKRGPNRFRLQPT